MTSYAILVRGYKIDIWAYYKVHGVQMPEYAEDFTPLSDHKVLVVSRQDDSNNWEDYGYYLADDIHDFDSTGPLDADRLRTFLEGTNRTQLKGSYCSEYGLFNDYYDFDEGFRFYQRD